MGGEWRGAEAACDHAKEGSSLHHGTSRRSASMEAVLLKTDGNPPLLPGRHA